MRIAIFQGETGSLTLTEKVVRLRDHVLQQEQRSEAKIDLLVCPELFASGYNIGDRLLDYNLASNLSIMAQIKTLANSLNIAILFGYPEKHENQLHNSAALVSAQGEVLANHRKRLSAPGSVEANYFTPGNCDTLLDFQGIIVAILICYELEFPEAVRAAAAKGAQLVLVPTALGAEWDVVASRVVPTRAFENGVWLAYANHAGEENGLKYLGGSKIVSPTGQIVAEANEAECLICYEIDLDLVEQAQQQLPYLSDRHRFQSP